MKDSLLPVITLVFGIFATYLSAKRKFRDDLQAKYNESLHENRMASYKNLWRELQVLALYARAEPVTPKRLTELAVALRQWYFEDGGLFLTDKSRDTYFALQDSIVKELAKNGPADKGIEGPAFETIRTVGSALRTSLSSDLRSRQQPNF